MKFDSVGLMVVLMVQMSEFACATDNGPVFKDIDKNEKIMSIIQRIVKYICWFFMMFHIGNVALHSKTDRMMLGIGTAFLLLVAFYNWYICHRRDKDPNKMMVAIVSCGIFILTGYCYRYLPLCFASVIYTALRVYSTSKEISGKHS